MKAIIAIMPEQTPIITGYEIDADENAAAVRWAGELAPRPHVRSEEVIDILHNSIANLRAEGKSGAERDFRFKRGENERAADDTSVWFGAKASMAAHGFDVHTAKELGLNITDKDTVAAANELAADVRRMAEIETFALTSDRPLAAKEMVALAILIKNLDADLGRINQTMAESANPAAFQAEKELVESRLNKAYDALEHARSRSGQSQRSLRVGVPDDVRDSEIYILRSMSAFMNLSFCKTWI